MGLNPPMTQFETPPLAPGEDRGMAGARVWPALAIAFVLLLQAHLVFTRAINWDEFYYYFEVYRFVADDFLARPLQTLHVRLFGWIVGIGSSSIDGIVAARCIMFACEMATAAAIAGIAAKFTDRTIGLVCALCYLSAGFVLQHGFSFRVDPSAAACLMGALWVLCCSRLTAGWLALFGVLVAVGGMITIKSALYAPAFAALAWYRWSADGFSLKQALRLVAAALLAGLCFGALFLAHRTGVTVPVQEAAAAATAPGKMIQSSADKMFSLGPQPYWADVWRAAMRAIPFTILILLVPGTLLGRDRPANQRIALAGLFLPLSTLAFFHNTAPYFYAFILPPVAAATCFAIAAIRDRVSIRVLSLALALNAFGVWAADGPSRIDNQRRLVAAVHEVFPEPVRYFDFCYMLSAYPKANGFMTLWGVDMYLESGKLMYRNALERWQVPLLLENDPMYTRLLREDINLNQFAPEDAETLKATFIHFWGPLWIAGQEIRAGAGPRAAELLVPGPYTVRQAPILIDGKRHEPGEVVTLKRGTYTLEAVSGDARLVWGNRLEAPTGPEPGEIWTYF